MKKSVIVMFFALGFCLRSIAQNIPIAEIVNECFKKYGSISAVLYATPGAYCRLIDTSQVPGSQYKLVFLRGTHDFDSCLQHNRYIISLDIMLLKVVPDTLRISLSLGKFEAGRYLQGSIPLGEAYGVNEIECIYDKARGKWIYLRTVETRCY